jgi:AbiV family abortive infection protein
LASSAEYSKLKLTPQLLGQYADAALSNASELLEEATLLFENGHHARAYFLAVASIEETGKALLAFDGQLRNLADPAIATKLKRTMEDHSSKIRSAFVGGLVSSPAVREAIMPAVDLMIHLQHGREPSMYTEIRSDTATVQSPSKVVRETAAQDCLRLAGNCLTSTSKHIAETKPSQKTKADDELYAMKGTELLKIMNTEDFWWYYIAQLESGLKDFSMAAVQYRKEFFIVGKAFQDGQGDIRAI